MNPGMGGVRCNHPEALDLSAFDSLDDLVVGQRGLTRNSPLSDAKNL